MADAKFYEAYSRFNDSTNKYESWSESVSRVMNMHRDYLSSKGIVSPTLSALIAEVEEAYSKKTYSWCSKSFTIWWRTIIKTPS